jgi:ubiquinol-cytochrome c reductase cytochrome c subunit
MRIALLLALLCGLAAPSALAADGPGLFAANCARCHGADGRGLTKRGPSLLGVGARAADFYLRTGYMPLSSPREQPSRSRVLFTDAEIRAMVGYVASLGRGPAIPHPQPKRGTVAAGQKLFVDHCAGCHQIVAAGGYVTGARVPPLADATDRQIAEAVRIGPYLMPRFPPAQLSDRELDSLIAYVDYAKHPDDRGGWSLGHLGPWPEGLVAWLIAAASLVALCIVLGRRLPS